MNRVLCWLPIVASMLACSSPSQPDDEVGGSLELAIQTNGVTINSVTYTITGVGYSQTSVLNVAKSTRISTLVGGLPVGQFDITLNAVDANDPSIRCTGAGSFDISAYGVSAAGVDLYCWRDSTTGSVAITGYVHRCPAIVSFSAEPSEVIVGEVMHLSAVVENTSSSLAYEWSASPGSLVGADTLAAELTCTSPGQIELQFLVVDLDAMCAASASAVVYCTAPEVPNGSPGPAAP